MSIRRVVFGHDENGNSVVLSDGAPPRARDIENLPGMSVAVVWRTAPDPAIPAPAGEPTDDLEHAVPERNAAHFVVLTLPPDASLASADIDPVKAGEELQAVVPHLGADREPDGMHATNSVDYGVIVSGEVTCVLDSGQQTTLRAGDTIVQNGGRHAWRNESDGPVTMAFVMHGAKRIATDGPAAHGAGPA